MGEIDEKPVLLVVEDEPEIARVIETHAQQRGYQVHSATDGLSAISISREIHPDVVLLDIALPGMDGRDVMRRLRAQWAADRAVIIFLTARDEQSDRILGLELGADDYETKPVHFQMLFSKIERLRAKKSKGPNHQSTCE